MQVKNCRQIIHFLRMNLNRIYLKCNIKKQEDINIYIHLYNQSGLENTGLDHLILTGFVLRNFASQLATANSSQAIDSTWSTLRCWLSHRPSQDIIELWYLLDFSSSTTC